MTVWQEYARLEICKGRIEVLKMETKIITKADLDKDNFFKEDSLIFDGHIEIEESLGYVKFKLDSPRRACRSLRTINFT